MAEAGTFPYSALEHADTTTGGLRMPRTASKRYKDPMIFASKVLTGSDHDTVGKLCAPKWKICVGWYWAKTCVTRCPFRRSHGSNRKFGSFGNEGEPSEPYVPTTFQPRRWRYLTMWEPMNPSAPVTIAVFIIRGTNFLCISKSSQWAWQLDDKDRLWLTGRCETVGIHAKT